MAKAGDSNSFCGREDFSLYLNQAREALRLGDKYAPHFWHYRFEDYAYIYLLEHCAAPFGPLQVCSPALRILQNYDTEKTGICTALCRSIFEPAAMLLKARNF